MDRRVQYDLVDLTLSGFSNVLPQQIVIENSQGWVSNVWETITYENNEDKPTRVDFETKLQVLVEALTWKNLREERNTRLAEVDWVVIRAFSMNTPVTDEWKTYMQALRDLPSTTEDPANVVWPVRPDEVVVPEEETSNVVVEEETSNVVVEEETSNVA